MTAQENRPHPSRFLLLALAAALLGYTVARAALVSLSHDEAMGYFYVFQHGLDKILIYAFPSSNNHLLNSILTRISVVAFGNSELAMRIPNLLAHVVYLAASLLFVRQFRSEGAKVAGFLLLNLNPFLLDFFSLARGYGLASGFTMLSVYFASRLFRGAMRDDRTCSRALWAAWLAVMSNFAFLTPYLSLAAVIVASRTWLAYREHRDAGGRGFPGPDALYRILVRENLVAIRNAFFLALAATPPILKLILAKELYYGGQNGFLADTVQSLVRASLYDFAASDATVRALAWGVTAVFAGVGAAAAWGLFRRRPDGALVGVFALLAVSVVSVLLQHALLGTRFVVDRGGLYFAVCFLAALALALDGMMAAAAPGGGRAAAAVACAAATLTFAAPWTGSLNLTHSLVWKYEADTPAMLATLNGERLASGLNRPVRLGINGLSFEPVINYYLVTQKLAWLQPVTRGDSITPGKGFQAEYDYYYLSPHDLTVMPEDRYTVVKRFAVTGNVLAKRK